MLCAIFFMWFFFIFFSEMLIGEPACIDNDKISQLIMENEGTQEDVLLSSQIIEYVLQKEICGATSTELRVGKG